MDEKRYYYLWLAFKKQAAQKAVEAVSSEVKEHYDQVLEDMALLEAEIMTEVS